MIIRPRKIGRKKYTSPKKEFYFCIPYNKNKPLWEEYNFTNAEIGKIVKLGMYITYSNELKFKNKVNITSENIDKILDLSKSGMRTSLMMFMDKNVFYFDAYPSYKTERLIKYKPKERRLKDNKSKHNKKEWVYTPLKINRNLMFKGGGITDEHKGYFKVYTSELNKLFEIGLSYVTIGQLFRLIPYMDKRDNSIRIDDIPKILSMHEHNKRKFLEKFLDCFNFSCTYIYFRIPNTLIIKE